MFSIVGRAAQQGIIGVEVTDIRDYTHDAHRTADDYQFGGGHGMVMKPEPVFEATETALSGYSDDERAKIPVILLTPQGELLTQRLVEELAQAHAVALICGHYAGVGRAHRRGTGYPAGQRWGLRADRRRAAGHDYHRRGNPAARRGIRPIPCRGFHHHRPVAAILCTPGPPSTGA